MQQIDRIRPSGWLSRLATGLALLAVSLPSANATTDELGREIERLLQAEQPQVAGTPLLTKEFLLEAYRENAYRPFWTDPDDVDQLQQLITAAEEHGLRPEDYAPAAISALLARRAAQPGPVLDAHVDTLLTESLIRYVYHRRLGKIKASSLDPDINYRREPFGDLSVGAAIRRALDGPSLESFVGDIAKDVLARWQDNPKVLERELQA